MKKTYPQKSLLPIVQIVILLLFIIPATAQDDWHFEDESELRLPEITFVGESVDGGDVNADGSIDLLIGCSRWYQNTGYEQLLYNIGDGYFLLADTSQFPYIDDVTACVRLFDCDGDHDFDAYIVNAGYESDYLAINDGSGNFSIDWQRIPPEYFTGIIANYADIDGDGDIDICRLGNALNGGDVHRVWINDGNGYFENENYRLPEMDLIYSTVEFADVDGDLDFDLLVNDRWHPGGTPRLFINDGLGYFIDETDSRIPVTDWSIRSEFVDIDGDADFDIVLGLINRCGFLINNGSGVFTDETDMRGPLFPYLEPPHDIKAFDPDNDGDEDIILGTVYDERPDRIFINTGNGFYEDHTDNRWPDQSQSTWELFLGDLDGDGDGDIFRVGDGSNRNSIFINTLNIPDSIPPAIKNVSIYPAFELDAGPYIVKLVAKDGVSIESRLAVSIYYSINGLDFLESGLHYIGGYMFYGTIPAVDSGITVNYYYTVSDNQGNISRLPGNAPDSVFSFTYDPDQTVIIEGNDNLLNQLKLSAYPNPSNSGFAVSYFVEHEKRLAIAVYDLNGRKVHSENLNKQSLSGWQKWYWDGWANLASGIYFIELNKANRREVRKAVLIR